MRLFIFLAFCSTGLADPAVLPIYQDRCTGYSCPRPRFIQLASCVAISRDNHGRTYVLTTEHVPKDVPKMAVQWGQGYYHLELIRGWKSPNAPEEVLLYRTTRPVNTPLMGFSRSTPQPGDAVTMIGYPSQRQLKLTTRVKQANSYTFYTHPPLPQLGMSGGAVVNRGGCLIGLIVGYKKQLYLSGTTSPLHGTHTNIVSLSSTIISYLSPGSRPPPQLQKPPEIRPAPSDPPESPVKPSNPKPDKPVTESIQEPPVASPEPSEPPAPIPIPIPTRPRQTPSVPPFRKPDWGVWTGLKDTLGNVPWADLITIAALGATGTGAAGIGLKYGLPLLAKLFKSKGGPSIGTAQQEFPDVPVRDLSEAEQILDIRKHEQRHTVHDALFGVLFEDIQREEPNLPVKEAWEQAHLRFNQMAPISYKTEEIGVSTQSKGD